MSRIVIDARESGTSTGRYVDKLIENLAKIDSTNQYFLLVKSHRLNYFSFLPTNFQRIKCDIKEFTFNEQFGLILKIRKLKPNLVHFTIVQQPILYFGQSVTTMQDLTTLRFRNPSKNPVVFWIKQRVYWLVNFIAPRKSQHIITISEFTKQDVMKTMHYNHPDKFTVTLNSADIIQEKAQPIKALAGKQYISYVGRHQPHKNLPRLIKAHAELLKTYPDLILAIAGKEDATTDHLKQQIDKEQMKNIVFTGFISDGQLKWLYENTACYVFPSLSEGFGLPGLEAMAHGAPVASSSSTSLPEVNGDAALYFDPTDVKDISRAVGAIISDKSLADDLRARGKKQAAKFSWQRTAEETLKVYRDVLKNK